MFDRNKVVGSFFGVAIGDALGMPVETWTSDQIEKTFDWIDDYIRPSNNHKWFSGWASGEITDDTQLTIAVANSIIENRRFDMDAIAKHHIQAFDQTIAGWGCSTRESVRALRSGCHWSKSATTGIKRYGGGNGIVMKLLPITVANANDDQIIQFSSMTHYTQVSALASLIHNKALLYCFKASPNSFDREYFCQMCYGLNKNKWQKMVEHLQNENKDNIFHMFDLIENESNWSDNEIINVFKGGCYVYESLPFCHAFFLRDEAWRDGIEPMLDAVNAGGDTDTNASIIGGMIGALNGVDVFPKRLIDGLKCKDVLLEVANKFCDALGVI